MDAEPYGIQLQIEGACCQNADALRDEKKVKGLLAKAIKAAGMSLLAGPYVAEEPPRDAGKGPGISGVALLCESHVVIHTYPEARWFFFEMLSCKNFNSAKVEKVLTKWSGSQQISSYAKEIGTNFPEGGVFVEG